MNVFHSQKKRKGFSLVELIVVILIIAILAVAVFAGGSAAIKKSQVSRTTSDLHNFSIAIESAMNETPSVANMKTDGYEGLKAIVDKVNANLSADYQLATGKEYAGPGDDTSNLKFVDGASYIILQSAKTDAWGNHYYAIFDFGERHDKGQSDFYITVVSAGPNAQTTVGGKIESDDIFLLTQYSDGDVSAAIYNCANGSASLFVSDGTTFKAKAAPSAAGTLVTKGAAGSLVYAGGADNTAYTAELLPVNF